MSLSTQSLPSMSNENKAGLGTTGVTVGLMFGLAAALYGFRPAKRVPEPIKASNVIQMPSLA